MKPGLLLILLLSLLLQARGEPAGRPLEAMGAGRKAPARGADESGWRVVGLDGPPAWHWPELPGEQVTYRAALAPPAHSQLHGLLIGAAGTMAGLSDTLTLRLRNLAGGELQSARSVALGGGGLLDTLWLTSALDLDGLDTLLVDLQSTHPGRPLWVTADDDCGQAGRSWIQVPSLSTAFQPLERDLNIRLLTRRTDADVDPPVIAAPAHLRCHPSRVVLPLRVRVREEDAVDSVWVSGAALAAGSLGLERIGFQAQDASWEEWRADLPASQLLASGQAVDLEIHARDLSGNVGLAPLTLLPEAERFWSRAGGRADQSHQSGFPATPGLVLAVAVDLNSAALDHGVSAVVVAGARLQLRGIDHSPPAPDSLLLRLVAAGSDGMPRQDSLWSELADPLTLGWVGACPEALAARFTLHDPGANQGQRAWLLLDYAHPSQAVLPSAPLLEWFAPDDTLASLNAAACSWTWQPLEERWARIPEGRLLVEALLEPLGCDRSLPFLADFDVSYPELACWTEIHTSAAGNPGWRGTNAAQANSTCFKPDGDGAGGLGEELVDPDGVAGGQFVFVNADALNGAAAQRDSLFTPWLDYTAGARLEFSMLGGGSTNDFCEVLVQTREGEQISPWQVRLSSEVAEDSLFLSGTTQVCGLAHGIWHRVGKELAPSGSSGELRLCFAYEGTLDGGQYGNGWAIDSIRVEPAAPAAGPFDGPSLKTAELGRIHPNPFNPETQIPFRMRRSGALRLEVYNITGQRVAVLLDEPFRRAGEYRAVFRPTTLASGLYLARLEAAGAVDVRRLVYLK